MNDEEVQSVHGVRPKTVHSVAYCVSFVWRHALGNSLIRITSVTCAKRDRNTANISNNRLSHNVQQRTIWSLPFRKVVPDGPNDDRHCAFNWLAHACQSTWGPTRSSIPGPDVPRSLCFSGCSFCNEIGMEIAWPRTLGPYESRDLFVLLVDVMGSNYSRIYPDSTLLLCCDAV